MQDDLLWVYEGLTQYYGDVLGARSAMWTPDQYRATLAEAAAFLGISQRAAVDPRPECCVEATLLADNVEIWHRPARLRSTFFAPQPRVR